ncbi:FAD-binding protein [Tomitella biformata]|uniref:FAD-binding protein n=1 Tax=Tomitella biformata TaxID=630403 RepID=UPI0004674F74|nr:FAD-binding protein [Tomitella biformata]
MTNTAAWDLTTEVLVLGFGGAGAAAALQAREAGAEVLAVDRFAGGGATTLSGGIVYAGGGTAFQRGAGVEDDPEQMYRYLKVEVGDAVRDETLRDFCETSAEMIDWLTERGVPFESSLCPYKTSYPSNKHYLYYSGSEAAGIGRAAATPAPRGHRARGAGVSGKALYRPLAKAAAARGIQLLPNTRVTALVTDGEGAVVGVEGMTMRDAPANIQRIYNGLVRVSDKPGVYAPDLRAIMQKRARKLEAKHARPIRIGAGKVILATGGFIANKAMVRAHAPKYRIGLPLGTAACDGSGITMAAELGAATGKMSHVSAWRFITPPAALMGSLAVNVAGARILDESRYGAALGVEMVDNHDGRGWLLLDEALLKDARTQLGPQTVWFQRMQMEGLLRMGRVSGATLEEVAQKAGIDPVGLRMSVDAHNLAITKDVEDPMGKPAEFRRPLITAPFSLLDISVRPSQINPTPMLTLGGLVVDEKTGLVQTTSGSSIPGLYAAGRAAVGICSNAYVSGLSIADAIYSGRRAGAHAAGR